MRRRVNEKREQALDAIHLMRRIVHSGYQLKVNLGMD